MRILVKLLLCCLMFSSLAFCSWTEYRYTGNAFTSISGPAPVTSSNFISGDFLLYTPLKPNLPWMSDIRGRVISMEFTDGVNTYVSGQPGVYIEESWVETDASGALLHWMLQLYLPSINGGILTSDTPPNWSPFTDATTNNVDGWSAQNIGDPGVWTVTTLPTPEPNSLALLGAGVLGMGAAIRFSGGPRPGRGLPAHGTKVPVVRQARMSPQPFPFR